ncbi:MAG TPA: hypothetical protein VIL69_24580, partial [Roseomonas sp.]
MTASPGGRTPPVLLASLLALPLLLAGCAPTGPDSAASQVLEEVLESHRASLAGLNAPPSTPRRAPPDPRRPAPGSMAAPGGSAAPGGVAALLGQTPDGVLATRGQPTRRRPEGNA